MIAVIDYDAGNIRSVMNALGRLVAEYVLTSDPELIRAADRVILPGVGEARSAMENLRLRGLDRVIPELECPVLGICIGMQLLCRRSDEGNVECLGVFDSDVRALEPDRAAGVKVPHVGWNRLGDMKGPLFRGLEDGTYVYFVHSFAADVCGDTIAKCLNGREFSAALSKRNFYGVQFHPEKSGAAGERIIANFLGI